MTEGTKFDNEKLRLDLLPPAALEDLAQVLTMGAKKYGDWNWHGGIKYSRLYAATLRHLLAWWDGDDLDAESGLNHLAHAMCNVAFLLQFISEGREELDDRRFKEVV
jgi:hypothetical protein